MVEFEVERKGYHRKGFTACRKSHVHGPHCYRVKPTHVPSTSFEVTARPHSVRARGGEPGVLIHVKHKGELGGKGFFSKPASVRRKKLAALERKEGKKHVLGSLRAIQVFNKNTNPRLSEEARKDAEWVNREFPRKRKLRELS